MLSVVGAVRDLVRLREISVVLVRHGFGEFVTRAGFGGGTSKKKTSEAPPQLEGGSSSAKIAVAGAVAASIPPHEVARGEDEAKRITLPERVRLVLEDLGPSFIKLGQIASTRNDLLPPDFVTELKKLQDDVPAVPFADVREQIETGLGATIEESFLSFEEKPLATASIGQVHRAVLAGPAGDDGESPRIEVVVKVQRPNVQATIARDLELLHILARALEKTIPETRIYSPTGLVDQFDRSITSELDFRVEADNAERFAQNFAGHPEARFPKVYRQTTSKNVLTLELFQGVKIDRAKEAGFDGKLVAKRALGVVVKMVFEDGFFHADPHPGNIFVMAPVETPVLGLIDLGMVGRLSPELRERTVDLMVAAVRKDPYAVADALYAIGRPKKKVDMREFRAEVSVLAEKYLGKPLQDIQVSAMIGDLVKAALKFDIEIPSDFMLVGKALMTIEGIGKELDPQLDVFAEAQPLFTDILKRRYSPARLGNELLRGVEQLSRAGYDLPMQLREVLDDLRLGRLGVQATDANMPRALDRLGRRVFTGMFVATTLASGAFLLNARVHPAIAYTFLVVAVVVWLSHALLDMRRG
jgi:ubiquinone biosynthesis protein